MKSNGCKSRPVKASEQAGSECCHLLGDWWVRRIPIGIAQGNRHTKGWDKPDSDAGIMIG